MQIKDPGLLRTAGTGALETARELHAKGKHGSEATADGSTAFTALLWSGELCYAMVQVAERWEEQTEALAQVCRDIHSQCSEAADGYSQSESDHTGTMRSAARQHIPFD
ncbi:hypothetical protein [Streptomyces sp. NPDC053427]|uniref:hypothetical protein n=1 Tax=Streptomyces sp. NPDC053427 TaxID=3365701 RepID=UPI0037D8A902